MMNQVSMAANSTPHRLPPLTYPKSLSPSRDLSGLAEPGGRPLTDTRGLGFPEGLAGTKERQERAARKKELARRHLSNSLQGMKTVLPDLRKIRSFSVPVPVYDGKDQSKLGGLGRHGRDTGSGGFRKPVHELHDAGAGVRRSLRLRETGRNLPNGSPVHPLSQSLQQSTHLSLAALVHELNANMHHHHHQSSPSHDHATDSLPSEENDSNANGLALDYENDGLDPDLCPRLTGHDRGTDDVADRALTPALRKLNRRRVSSRVRTQQWVNQIEREQRLSERQKNEAEGGGRPMVMAPLDLLYDVGFQQQGNS